MAELGYRVSINTYVGSWGQLDHNQSLACTKHTRVYLGLGFRFARF